jgi:hypothetical protein
MKDGLPNDDNGWFYAPRFAPALAGWTNSPSMIRLVRRRRWLRLRGTSPMDEPEPKLDGMQVYLTSAEDIGRLAPGILAERAAALSPPLSLLAAVGTAAELVGRWGGLLASHARVQCFRPQRF